MVRFVGVSFFLLCVLGDSVEHFLNMHTLFRMSEFQAESLDDIRARAADGDVDALYQLGVKCVGVCCECFR